MTIPKHTFGADCRLAPLEPCSRDDGIPALEAQYFYSSAITIDDPNWTSAPSDVNGSGAGKSHLRAFGRGDNNALERAWRSLMSKDDRALHNDLKKKPRLDNGDMRCDPAKRDDIVRVLGQRHSQLHLNGLKTAAALVQSPTLRADTNSTVSCCEQLATDITTEIDQTFCSEVRHADPTLQVDVLAHDVTTLVTRKSSKDSSDGKAVVAVAAAMPIHPRGSGERDGMQSLSSTPRSGLKMATKHLIDAEHEREAGGRSRSLSQATNRSSHTTTGSGLTGQPFARAAARDDSRPPSAPSQPTEASATTASANQSTPKGENKVQTLESEQQSILQVTVGVSKLHVVSLPTLQMKPIYWSPVNDVAVVTRATWFYRDTMLPVTPVVANQLEAGFQEMQPWTETWRDEVRCAIDIGPDGEEKLSHPLWPSQNKSRRSIKQSELPTISADLFCSSHCSQGDAAAQGSIDTKSAQEPSRPYANYHVIYKDTRDAFLLKHSLKPSAYYGRRPVYAIDKGFAVGIPVTRGFDREIWDRYRLNKFGKKKVEAEEGVSQDFAAEASQCTACEVERERGQISDLVLVAHGIGQKIAERVESYHFTHAINSFRRSVNTDLHSPSVQKVMRDGCNGFMILPLNWRMGISIEEDDMREGGDVNASTNSFGLKDIEPDTIPAIRSMMSDVMFDIPFYMSQHKNKMISSLIYEANRVYRLWCANNPGFASKGRVHLIAHSLGSVMAVDILSRQPTYVPEIDLKAPSPSSQFLEFDTSNLFLLGSPAGFFILLERGALLPRRGRLKPGADRADAASESVTGEAGQFGCVAVNNIYNVLAKEDPIAYLLNGSVDVAYSSTLKPAYVPSSVPSLLTSMGNAVRQVIPGMTPAVDPLAQEPERPSAIRLPSQLELEVHNFTREEIAERKAYLLNDNGQIDWYLQSGGGPLEMQYLNMLSAHTSYWTNPDFIRMVCLEIGRKPGRANTFPVMRAAKAGRRGKKTAK